MYVFYISNINLCSCFIQKIEGKEVLEKFAHKAQYPKTERPDYDELKRILSTELEKHKNEPKYNSFDWLVATS